LFNFQRRGRLRPEKYPFFHDEKFTRVRETKIDPFGGAKPRLLRRGKEAPLRVNPEQAQAACPERSRRIRPGSRRVDLGWCLAK
jgi:hypothetical protein